MYVIASKLRKIRSDVGRVVSPTSDTPSLPLTSNTSGNRDTAYKASSLEDVARGER